MGYTNVSKEKYCKSLCNCWNWGILHCKQCSRNSQTTRGYYPMQFDAGCHLTGYEFPINVNGRYGFNISWSLQTRLPLSGAFYSSIKQRVMWEWILHQDGQARVIKENRLLLSYLLLRWRITASGLCMVLGVWTQISLCCCWRTRKATYAVSAWIPWVLVRLKHTRTHKGNTSLLGCCQAQIGNMLLWN